MGSVVKGISYAANPAMSARLLLHVDDDDDEGFLLERAISKSGLTGWDFKYLSSGTSAQEYLTQAILGEVARPHLLVLDVRMPRVDGFELLEWASSNVPEIPAVMLSTSELLQDRLRARDLGSKGYFVKSPDFFELLEFLRVWDETAFARKVGGAAAVLTH